MAELTPHQITRSTLVTLPAGAAPPTPASGKVVVYGKADKLVYSKDDTGTETQMSAPANDPILKEQSGYASAYVSATGVASVDLAGLFAGATVAIPGGSALIRGAAGCGIQMTSSGTLNQGGIISNYFTGTTNPIGLFKFKYDDTSNVRHYAGFSGNNISAVWQDDPINTFAGLQFSSYRPDTNFQFMAKNSITQTLVDTGVPVDTAVHYLLVEVNGATSIVLTLYNASFVQQATTTITTNLPVASTQWSARTEVLDATGGAAKSVTFYFMHVLLRL